MLNNNHSTERQDTMQVCLNGHVVNADFYKYPKLNKDNCEECGAETITNCPNPECNKPIPGNLRRATGMTIKSRQSAPNFCQYCNKAFPWTSENETVTVPLEVEQEKSIEVLQRVFSKFHLIVQKLSDRYNNRDTFDIKDEYDVQDLLSALLILYFDDIRPEEPTPSYAAKSAKMDFLLKNEKIGIEVKMTRKGLTDKEIGEQLIIDIKKYKTHPDCETLICFIYAPEYKIKNPNALINDLQNQSKDDLKTRIFIYPS